MTDITKGKATRMRFTPQQKIAIYEHFCASDGKLNQEQLGQWAFKEFNLEKPISQSTISNIIINPEKHYKNLAKGIKGTSSRSGKMPALEKDIEEYIVKMTKEQTSINRAIILAYAKTIANEKYHMNEMPASEQLNFSDGWLTRTMARLAALHEGVDSIETESSKLESQIKRIQEPKRKIVKVPVASVKRSKKRMNVGYLCTNTQPSNTAGSSAADTKPLTKETSRAVIDPEVARQELKDGIEKVLAYWLPITEEEEKVLPLLRNTLLEIQRDEKYQQGLKQSSIHQYFK